MQKDHILLLHGALGSKQQLQELKKHLSPHFYVSDLNFEGHGGRSSHQEFSINLFMQNVIDKMHELNIERTHIFGYSMGGYVALSLAARKPELVHKIFTLGTKFAWNEKIAAQEIRKLNPEKIEAKVPAFAKYLDKLHHPSDWKTVVTKTADLMVGLGRGKKLRNEDLGMINHQVQITIGELDNMVSLDESKEAAAQLQNGRLLVLPSIQHPIERVPLPALAEAIIDFI